ncbi:class I SAM-dependent methyltransferase [Phenylobacterium sp. 20VBR1]|uniref:Class I SAM-dependent methyltransferase n=1 Tax=Phenylobacterium glaciei TaxID=2803784 RepID=A0A941HUP5_9CAUL|nr:class I SAM-dependent methyltransferase [Phenylobacterium glaciei]MBR7617835.1 class I SAM-dependent methyltransferase [Phenylobacterium glaciei]
MADALRALATMNHRFAPQFAKTMLATPRADADAAAFARHCEAKGFEFTEGWADQNIPFVSPLLRDFAAQRGSVRYMEIGAYEGRNLAFMDWLLPAKLDVTVIDPWFDQDLNPEEKYHAVEPRFARNTAKLGFSKLTTHKGFSTYELPRMLERGEAYDLIYIDGSHTAWAVGVDLAYCAALLNVGGMMVLDDYWHHESEIGGPGVKQAVDAFHGVFRRYFDITAVYRQVALTKILEIPR